MDDISDAPQPGDAPSGGPGCLSMLQRLTYLGLETAAEADLHAFASCTRLQELHVLGASALAPVAAVQQHLPILLSESC